MTEYPTAFPLAAQLKVEEAKNRQGKKFLRRMQKRMPGPWGMPDDKALYYLQPRRLGRYSWKGKPEDLLIIRISAVWLAFVSAAGRCRLWPQSNDWDWQTMEFLRQLVSESYSRSEFGWGGQSTVNPEKVDRIVKRVMQQIQDSKTGQYVKDVRREMLKALVEPVPKESTPAGRSELIDRKIEEVERETGRDFNREKFALVTGYNVRNLQLFQKGEATSSVDEAFNRVLNLPAKTIVEILDKKARR